MGAYGCYLKILVVLSLGIVIMYSANPMINKNVCLLFHYHLKSKMKASIIQKGVLI